MTQRLSRRTDRLLSIATAMVLLGCVLALFGCSTAKKLRKISFLPTETLGNGGRTYYIVVRSVDENAFLLDSYQKIADMVTATPLPPSILKVEMFWPGQKRTLIIQAEDDKAVAVYALFTNPSNDWKVLLAPPLKRSYKLYIDGNRLVRADELELKRDKRSTDPPNKK